MKFAYYRNEKICCRNMFFVMKSEDVLAELHLINSVYLMEDEFGIGHAYLIEYLSQGEGWC